MAKEEQQNISLSAEQLKELMTSIAAEFKKPTVLEQRKLDEEAKREEQRRQFSVDMAKNEIEQQRNRQLSCGHHNGRHPLFVGQKTTGGDFFVQCLRCQTPYSFNQASLPEGFQISEATATMAPGACERWLETMEKQFPPKVPARRYRAQLAEVK